MIIEKLSVKTLLLPLQCVGGPTTKPAGEGTGLGLSLSYDIVVKELGGSIFVESKEGMETEFIVEIPLAGENELTVMVKQL